MLSVAAMFVKLFNSKSSISLRKRFLFAAFERRKIA